MSLHGSEKIPGKYLSLLEYPIATTVSLFVDKVQCLLCNDMVEELIQPRAYHIQVIHSIPSVEALRYHKVFNI
jgi:hypothetical protein